MPTSKQPAGTTAPVAVEKEKTAMNQPVKAEHASSTAVSKSPESQNGDAKVPVHPKLVLREYVASRLCQVSGGSCKDPSTPISEIRAKLNISDAQWTKATTDLRSSLEKRKISAADQDEAVSALTSLQHEVAAESATQR